MGSPRTAAGTRLGRYQVIKHLTHGGMAEVLLARSVGIEGFERHVVLKRIRAEQARDEQYVKMFLDEARLAAALHHQNIVQVHDIGESDGEYFFAMEYIHGEDLRTLLTTLANRRGLVPIPHLVTIVAAAASGLHHAHEQKGSDRRPLGIVHRDVSPANILVGYDGGVKLVDFGIAKAALRSAETRSGTLKGKVSYMSPEQCIGTAVDRRSDVFALGIVLYELATVRRLFKGSSDFLTMTAIVQGNIPPPTTHRPDLPMELEAIIMKALSPRPEDRYATCEELRAALESYADVAQLRTSSSALAAYMKKVLGERPEPWLAEGERAILDVDFDGPGDGVVPASVEVAKNLVLPAEAVPRRSSPLMKARAKSITNGQFRVPTPQPGSIPIMEIGPETAAAAAAATGWNAPDDAMTSASGTPVAWAPETPVVAKPKKRGLVIGIAAMATVGIAIAIFLVARPTDTTSTVSTPTQVEARPAAPPAPPPEAKAPEAKAPEVKPPAPPPPAEPVVETKPAEPTPAEPTVEKPAVAKKPRVAKPKPKVEPTKIEPTKSQYDPKSLFPKK